MKWKEDLFEYEMEGRISCEKKIERLQILFTVLTPLRIYMVTIQKKFLTLIKMLLLVQLRAYSKKALGI